MKRDMDLARQILLNLEESKNQIGPDDVNIKGYSKDEIAYHIMLLGEAGLINAYDCSTFDGPNWRAERLTWQGHEFIEASRDQKRWNQAKKLIKDKGVGLTFDVAKVVLIKLMTDRVIG
jgi:DNA-binding transcriptional ArsR family regulator